LRAVNLMDSVFPQHLIIQFIEDYELFVQRKKERKMSLNLYEQIIRSNISKL
jgi:hypothetical protein